MDDEPDSGDAKQSESEKAPSFNPPKVQDLVKAGRDDLDPKETEE